MLVKLSKKMTNYFIKKNVVNAEQRDIYNYCFEVMLSTLLNLLAIIIIAIATKTYIESLLFSIGFMLMRGTAGGYHADTHFRCFITLMAIYSVMLITKFFIPDSIKLYLSVAFLIYSCIVVLIFAPIDSINKILSKEEKKHQRKKSLLYLIILILVASIMLIFAITQNYAYGLSYALFAVSTSMIAGFLKNKIQIKKQ